MTTREFSVVVNGDILHELDETFFVSLSGATGAVIADNMGMGTIRDDDPLPAISINNVSRLEGQKGNTDFEFWVTLSHAYTVPVTVTWATANGTATIGNGKTGDYRAGTGTLTFTPGQVSQKVIVRVIADRKNEPNETFFVNLTGATNGTIVDNQGMGTIENDDGSGGGSNSLFLKSRKAVGRF